ncbi:MAG: LytTR family DNA-binding domain-containing protein [Bacteroidota bacterium]
MDKLKCVIVDDEEMARRVIQSHLSHVEDMEVVGSFQSAVAAFLELEKIKADVLFLDIQMPKMTGLAMLKMMPQQPLTVLTTAHREYALEGFDLDVVDYLLKPVSLERFLKTIAKIKRIRSQESTTPLDQALNYLFVKANRNYVKILFDDILYIEALKNHIKIITKQQVLLTLSSISEFLQRLPEQQFIRVHRSFIVNKQQIQRFNALAVVINDQNIPIGRSYREETKDLLEDLLS